MYIKETKVYFNLHKNELLAGEIQHLENKKSFVY